LNEKMRNFLKDFGLASISSVALFLAFHPADISFLAWVALAPWLAILALREPGRAFLIGISSGFLHFLLSLHWIGVVTYAGLAVSAVYSSVFIGLFALLYSYSARKLRIPIPIAGPVIWVAVEYARSNFFFLAFPWMLAGHTQHEFLPVIQIADLAGVYGVSFVLVLVNSVIAHAFIYWRLKRGSLKSVLKWSAAAIAVLAGVITYGFWKINCVTWEEGASILVVQGNVPQDLKEESFKDLEILGRKMKRDHIELTREVTSKPTDLVVWPETMWPGFLHADPEGFAQISALAKQTNTFMLLGTQRYVFNGGSKRRNSAALITPDGKIEGIYDKMFLVPVSEYVPLENALPFLKFTVSQMIPYESESLTHGEKMAVFDVAGSKFSVLICFELSFDWLVRRAINEGADYIVNISNDGWFRTSAELDLALSQGVFRAVENRTGVVRSVNTGISCFIDPLGRKKILEVDGRRKQVAGTLHGKVALRAGNTLFTRMGNWFAALNLLLAAAVALHAGIRAVRRKRMAASK